MSTRHFCTTGQGPKNRKKKMQKIVTSKFLQNVILDIVGLKRFFFCSHYIFMTSLRKSSRPTRFVGSFLPLDIPDIADIPLTITLDELMKTLMGDL